MARKRGPRRPWSMGEKILVSRYYPWGGAPAVLEAYERNNIPPRSATSIRQHAKARGIRYAHPKGYVRLAEVHPICGHWNTSSWTSSHTTALRAAKRDGVLRTTTGHHQIHMVPIEWAEKYVREYGERNAVDEARGGVWLTTQQAARVMGITTSYLTRARKHPGTVSRDLARALEGVRTEQGVQAVYWEPTGVELAARSYRKTTTRRRGGGGAPGCMGASKGQRSSPLRGL